ncbi:hypothetical protein EDB87DRAFT_288489 [Lactarius vividus]|nr:hypothetical protein EDB87DRAFT_288489 [Lactarius vividus]
MFMFGTTTFMFALGIVALVLRTALRFQLMRIFLNLFGNVWTLDRIFVVYMVEATIARLMGRLQGASCCLLESTKGYTVYSQRYYLCLTRGGSLEQRQTRHRYSSVPHPWDRSSCWV